VPLLASKPGDAPASANIFPRLKVWKFEADLSFLKELISVFDHLQSVTGDN